MILTGVILALVAFAASVLTFFSGFGLGTLLLAFMLLYFPTEIAIALTAVVHLFNNVFKWWLTKSHIDRYTVFNFGLPAILGAIAGVYALSFFTQFPALYNYSLYGHPHSISTTKIVVGSVMFIFVIWDWIPAFSKINFSSSHQVLGGLITGFFGGLSGHQGALRSAFLVKGNLDKNTFIATGVAIACLIDLTRIPLYINHIKNTTLNSHSLLLAVCIIAALTGSIAGNFWLQKVTLKNIQTTVAIMVMIMAILLITGIL
ncbi:MAG: sulfite exporter TauE/SafE family protein [Saprospiraceae bacterium]|nr:sulfite exporter TauE/SafE family protein [Saprospiraceae bacterium]